MDDSRFTDADRDLYAGDEEDDAPDNDRDGRLRTEEQFRRRAAEVYEQYAGPFKRRFRWLGCERFLRQLVEDLRADVKALLGILESCGEWDAARDAKLDRLVHITRKHPGRKILVFIQFADTGDYLVARLSGRMMTDCHGGRRAV